MTANSDASKAWERYTSDAVRSGQFSRWPNEAMLKVLFGSYLKEPRRPTPQYSVLDVGCGVGQNLLPFIDMGCSIAGVELTEQMLADARSALGMQGSKVDFRVGANRSLPFPDNTFDLVLSINALHYETSRESYLAALAEFSRVIKPGGRLYLSTTGPDHELRAKATSLGNGRFKITKYDFRDDEVMYFLNSEQELAEHLNSIFDRCEVGRVSEHLMERTLDFFIAVAAK